MNLLSKGSNESLPKYRSTIWKNGLVPPCSILLSGRDGIIQIGKTLFSLWSLVKEMHTETRAQNIKAGGVVTYYNYLGKATL